VLVAGRPGSRSHSGECDPSYIYDTGGESEWQGYKFMSRTVVETDAGRPVTYPVTSLSITLKNPCNLGLE
jgi:hypothetical protein